MPEITKRIKNAWNAFTSRDPTEEYELSYGSSASYKPDRIRLHRGSERSIITSVYNRIAIDCAAIDIRHIKMDENNRYLEDMKSSLNDILTVEANIDQTGRAFIQDAVMSMLDEGHVALVITKANVDPSSTESYEIGSLRVGKVTQWFPQAVRVDLYNEDIGRHQEVILPKKNVAIIENPLYAVMNEPNSTLQRLIRKLNLLDVVDEQSGSGKLDLIIQLPYVIKTESRKQQAENRRKDIEMQLSGSKYGIAYTDGTERITQLNRPAENNLLKTIEYLTSMLYGQLGMTEEIFKGNADEKTMLNYYNRTIEPILSAIVLEMRRKFLSKTARTQHQSIMFFRDPFKLVPVQEMADISDKLTRNEIASPNEIRSIIGWKPSADPKADELRNRNISQSNEELQTENQEVSTGDSEMDEFINNL
jgi:hypothetical protein